MHKAIFMKESTEQRPRLIQTGEGFSVSSGQDRRVREDEPAMGGKRKASKARNMSLEHIF